MRRVFADRLVLITSLLVIGGSALFAILRVFVWV